MFSQRAREEESSVPLAMAIFAVNVISANRGRTGQLAWLPDILHLQLLRSPGISDGC